MAAYLVVDTDWKDTSRDTRVAFGQIAQPVITTYGGTFLTQPGQPNEPLEGDWHPEVLSIVEFPDSDAVRAMWSSTEYRDVIAFRQSTNAVFKVVLIDGVPA
jgi:uncharacterized protein (DUF1330 family)